MELVLVKLVTSVSIMKEVSVISGLNGFSMYMFSFLVPPTIPTISVIPVVNGQQVSINLSIDVSSRIDTSTMVNV